MHKINTKQAYFDDFDIVANQNTRRFGDKFIATMNALTANDIERLAAPLENTINSS